MFSYAEIFLPNIHIHTHVYKYTQHTYICIYSIDIANRKKSTADGVINAFENVQLLLCCSMNMEEKTGNRITYKAAENFPKKALDVSCCVIVGHTQSTRASSLYLVRKKNLCLNLLPVTKRALTNPIKLKLF